MPISLIKGINMSQNLLKTMNATIVTGQNKKSYLTIGKLFIYNDGGMSLKLDALPSNGQPKQSEQSTA